MLSKKTEINVKTVNVLKKLIDLTLLKRIIIKKEIKNIKNLVIETNPSVRLSATSNDVNENIINMR